MNSLIEADVDSEEELQQWLESRFEKAGWDAIREVSPHRSSERADLLVRHEDVGNEWIGIEVKYLPASASNRKLAAAFEQAVRYRNRNYLGERVLLWAVCPYVETKDGLASSAIKWAREFYCYFGIGIVDLTKNDLVVDFMHSNTRLKIPVDAEDRREHSANIEMIRGNVSGKLGRIAEGEEGSS